jgi:hypothetical protein
MKKLSLLFSFLVLLAVSCSAQKWYPISYKASFIDSVKYAKPIRYMGTLLTPTGAEFNKVHGLTASTAELNQSVGVTSPIQTQFSAKQATLISGVNISTVGGHSLLDGSDIPVAGMGSVTQVGVTNANGISAVVTNPTSAVNILVSLGAITPSSVNGIVFSGSSTPTLAVTGTSAISGTNTGDNAVNSRYSGLVSNATHTGDVTGATTLTIANGAVTLAKMANMATSSLIYRKTAGTGAPEVNTLATLKTDLGLSGTNSGDQTNVATATALQTARTINTVSFDGTANISVPSNITPGASGNIMQSNGSVWTSVTPPATIDFSLVLNTQISAALTDGVPTAAEINAATALTPATAGAGYHRIIKDNNGTGLLYYIESDGTYWYYTVMTKAL